MSTNTKNSKDIYFEELHIRHINLLLDLKNNQFKNWFYKMAIINTFDELKIFISNLDKNKNKCFIAIQTKKIIGFLNTYPLNEKKTCIKINTPIFIDKNYEGSRRTLILELIRKSISHSDLKTSSWIINAEINNNDLISCSRELGFQPSQEIKLWRRLKTKSHKKEISLKKITNNYLTKIDRKNIQKVLNFIRSNESIHIRNIIDLEHKDIYKRNNKFCGSIFKNNEIIFTILKDIYYREENVYYFTRGKCWDERITSTFKDTIELLFESDPNFLLRTYYDDKDAFSFLTNNEFIESRSELILIRNNLIKRESKDENVINNSIQSILKKITPDRNPMPEPFPMNLF